MKNKNNIILFILLISYSNIISQVILKDTFYLNLSILNYDVETRFSKIPLLVVNPSIKDEIQKSLLYCSKEQNQSIGFYEFTSSNNVENYFIAIGMTSYIANIDKIPWTGIFFIDSMPFFCRTKYYNEDIYENYPSGDSITISYNKVIDESMLTEILLSSFSGEVVHKEGSFRIENQIIKYYIDRCNNFSGHKRRK